MKKKKNINKTTNGGDSESDAMAMMAMSLDENDDDDVEAATTTANSRTLSTLGDWDEQERSSSKRKYRNGVGSGKRRSTSSGSADGGAHPSSSSSSSSPFSSMLLVPSIKRVTLEVPMELWTSGVDDEERSVSIASRASKSRLNVSATVPVNRHWTASIHSHVGIRGGGGGGKREKHKQEQQQQRQAFTNRMNGLLLGHSSTLAELEYTTHSHGGGERGAKNKTTTTTNNNNNNKSSSTTSSATSTFSTTTKWTSGVTLAETPTLTVGASTARTKHFHNNHNNSKNRHNNKSSNTTTWSIRLTSPPAITTIISQPKQQHQHHYSYHQSHLHHHRSSLAFVQYYLPWWWNDVACKASWSRDHIGGSCCTLRTGLGLRLGDLISSSTPTTTTTTTSSSSTSSSTSSFVPPTFSVSLASRNTTHKWNVSTTWNARKTTTTTSSKPSITSITPDTNNNTNNNNKTHGFNHLLHFFQHYQPSVAFSLSPKLPSSTSRICNISAYWNLWDATWSCSSTLTKGMHEETTHSTSTSSSSSSSSSNGSNSSSSSHGEAGRTNKSHNHHNTDSSKMTFGWTRSKDGSWTYLFSWTTAQGYTLRIPLAIIPTTSAVTSKTATATATAATAAATGTAALAAFDPLWYPIQILYVTFVSCIVQDAVAQACMMSNNKKTTTTSDADTTDKSVVLPQPEALRNNPKRQKALQEATHQQLLMQRTAQNRTKLEQEKNGLVIQKAVYFTDAQELDVTIPLQFWVMDSVLQLGPSSKRDLLGFCDLSYKKEVIDKNSNNNNNRDDDKETSNKNSHDSDHHYYNYYETMKLWMTGFWSNTSLNRSRSKPKSSSSSSNSTTSRKRRIHPQLRIEYNFRGQAHVTVVQDKEAVTLPNSRDQVVTTKTAQTATTIVNVN